MSTDPFADHPGLRGKINDPMSSFFRINDLRDVMLANPQTKPFWHLMFSPQERIAARDKALADHRGDLWIFAYGSLMWDPALRFNHVLRARAEHHERAFILRDIYGGRGTQDAPGLMAALDHGGGCDGLIFRVPEPIIMDETEILFRREYVGPGYEPRLIDVKAGDKTVKALAFLADHDSEIMAGDISRQEQIHYVATGKGFMGTSLEYLKGIHHQFKAIGITDPKVDALLEDVIAYRKQNGLE